VAAAFPGPGAVARAAGRLDGVVDSTDAVRVLPTRRRRGAEA